MQYFYLIMLENDVPGKIFLQEHQAVKYGRTQVTKYGTKVCLYRQPITTKGNLKFVKELYRFE